MTTFTLIGGPTAVLEVGGLSIITDPTFDPPQIFTGAGTEGTDGITKTAGPAIRAEDLGAIDVALVSHDQHIDNLDVSGRSLLKDIPHVFTTGEGARRLGGTATSVEDHATVRVPLPGGGELSVTGVPAHHGPAQARDAAGPVTGFVVHGEGLPTVYVSGDNSDLEVVSEVATRFPAIDFAVLFAGGARFEELGGVYLTLSNEMVLEAAEILDRAIIIPVHADGWAHFSQSASELVALFESAGLGDRIIAPPAGERVTLSPR